MSIDEKLRRTNVKDPPGWLYWLLMQEHFQSLARGVIDARDVFFFVCTAIAGVVLTIPLIRRLTRL